MRACFICKSKQMCGDREPEVIAAEAEAAWREMARMYSLRRGVEREEDARQMRLFIEKRKGHAV